MLDEEVRPISSFGFTPWRAISLSMPQVENGWAAMAMMSASAFLASRAWLEKLVSSRSHFDSPLTSKPSLAATSFMTAYQVAREWAKFSSTPP